MAPLAWLIATSFTQLCTTHAFSLGLYSSPRLGRFNLAGTRAAAVRAANGASAALDLHCVEVDLNTGGVGPRPGLDAPPVLVLHGLLGQSRNFASWAKDLKGLHLEPGQRLFLADLRNHGASPHAPSMAYGDQAADVVGLLDRLEITAAVLVGHSMGGKVAMATALLHPGRVSALCVIDIAPVRYSVADGSDWRLADAMVRELAKLPLHELSSKRDARLSGAIVDPAMRAFALTNLLEDLCATSGQKTLAWKINLVAIEQQLRVVAGADLPAGVRPFKGPTLFVKGGASRYVDEVLHLGPGIKAGLFPDLSVETIPGAGHWVHVTNPKDLHAAVAALVRR